MSLVRCHICGCVENTALCYAFEHTKDKQYLCSECDPQIGKWHGKFEKRSADGYYYDERGHIYSSEEIDEDTMELIYNRNFKMIGRYETDCLNCGLCCQTLDPYYNVEIFSEDKVPEDMTEIRKGYMDKTSRYMKLNLDRHCIAYDKSEKKCNIYDIRPIECRQFERNGVLCLKLREKFCKY